MANSRKLNIQIKKTTNKGSFFVFYVFFYLIFISPCPNLSAKEPDKGDTLVASSIADARTLVPILASDSASASVCGLIFNGLLKYDKDINLTGDLAESWEVKDSGLTIIFHLRKGVKWHDGKDFTAYDVEFTYKKLIDPTVKTPYSGDFQKVRSVEVIDDHTVKVTYLEPFSPGLSSWGMSIMPKHILEKEDLNSSFFSRCPVGTGPYKFKFWKSQEKIVLEANPDYFEHEPYISRYIYRVIPDQATMFLELLVEGADYSGLTPIQYLRQTDSEFFKKTFNKFRQSSFGFTYLGFNLKDPLFKDKRVRQAIDHAIDKQEIIKGVLFGLGRACTGPFIPESWAYNDAVSSRPFDQKKALELLNQAGWSDSDADGWLDRQGEILQFSILTNQGNDQRKASAEIIQKRLEEIGIRVKIKVIEWSAFISEFIDKKRFQAVLLGWSLSRDPDSFDIWHSSKTKEGEFNFISYKNEQVDSLLIQGRRVFDQEQRATIYKKVHELIFEDTPYVFLYIPDSLAVVHTRINNVKPAPIGLGYNLIDWWVENSQQKYKRSLIRK